MALRWLFSKTVREARAVHKHYRRLLAAQCDILPPGAIAPVQLKLNELDAAIQEGHPGRINIKAEELQFAANECLKPYPHPVWRENVEVLLVAVAVAMSIRTFLLQPFKIPTGSMQPTLYGVTSTPDFSRIDYWQPNRAKVLAQVNEQIALRHRLQIPPVWERCRQWFTGNSYLELVAKNDGELQAIDPPVHFLINIRQTLWIGGVAHTLWFPPDLGEAPLAVRAGLQVRTESHSGQFFHQGDEVLKMCVQAGDHLFVDRVTYNFRPPKRGEIIVFTTAGTRIEDQNEFYIKRLTVLPGERVQIGDDRHLIINGRRLDAATPHFGKVYGFDPAQPPAKSRYSGHVNGATAEKDGLYPNLAPLFPDAATVYTNAGDAYLVMGDNTCDSSDSRTWGPVPAGNVSGRAFFVYWPLTSRFGWGNQ
jgi:signal peptidase I